MVMRAKMDKTLRKQDAGCATRQETPCFTPGTLIATAKGEKFVQDLHVGDAVVTRDNGLQLINWIGHRKVTGRELANAPHLNPILIRAGSLGDGLPERDMRVSPNHRMLVNSEQTALYFEDREVLVAAKYLVNHRGVFEVESLSATYIHFMFDRHEVVLADGSWTESFQPTDQTLRGIGNAQRQEIFAIFPDLRMEFLAPGVRPARRVLSELEARKLFEEM